MSPEVAKIHHEKYLLEHQKSGEPDCLKDLVLNPNINTIRTRFKSWKTAEKAGFKHDFNMCRLV